MNTVAKPIRAIRWLSTGMVITGMINPLISCLDGKKSEQWPLFIMIAGGVGLFSYVVLKSLDERISRLERAQSEKSKGESGSPAK